jgi:intracellular sulfur oxidation DsrE/DsrF family protein
MTQSRRSFIAALALGTTASAFPLLKEIEDLNLDLQIGDDQIADANDWLEKVKGSKKIVYDGSSFNKGFSIHWNWAFYQSYNDMKVPDSEITAVSVFRAMGIAPAFKSALWEKYAFGEFFKINDPQTGEPSVRNFTDHPQKGDLPGGGVTGTTEMLGRGALFCVCGAATKIISGIFAKRMDMNPEEVYEDFKNHLIDGVQMVPTGVWALGEVQAKGCGYIFAG